MKKLLWIVTLSLAGMNLPAGTPLPPKEKLHLYILMGQSNMAGRGQLETEDRTPHPRVLVFTLSNQWAAATEPITRDRKAGLGVGPGLAFGKAMAEREPEVTIGLVPCAVGGTPLSRWMKGHDLYSNAVVRAKAAMAAGTLKGILWHQGESDSGRPELAESYGQRLEQMVRDIRGELEAPELPFVAGQIGEFLYDRGPDKSPYARVINQAIADLPKHLAHAAFVPSKGLQHKGDVLHFDSAAQREMGRRFAEAMIRLTGGKAKATEPQP